MDEEDETRWPVTRRTTIREFLMKVICISNCILQQLNDAIEVAEVTIKNCESDHPVVDMYVCIVIFNTNTKINEDEKKVHLDIVFS